MSSGTSFYVNLLCLIKRKYSLLIDVKVSLIYLRSGLPNFCTVAMALSDFGYEPRGIRLDSGDLAYLSTVVREKFRKIADKYEFVYNACITVNNKNV